MRMRRKPWAEAEINENPFMVCDYKLIKGGWSETFMNQNPIHVEIGSGKGRFILESAKKYPHINFVGLERQISVCAMAAKMIRESGAQNVKMINTDGKNLEEIFAEGEVDQIYINFCDPWHKKRCAKRRLTHHNFLNMYKIILSDNGKIAFKTDNRDLFNFSLNELLLHNWLVRNASLDLHNDDKYKNDNIMTEYEQKFSESGAKIYKLEAVWGGEKELDKKTNEKTQITVD